MPSTQASGLPPSEWSALDHRRGVPWWGAVALAVGFAVLGVAIDLLRGDTLTRLFLVLYVLGCLAAVVAVRHRSLFTAVVQPPLVLAVAVPLVVLALGSNTDGSTRSKIIAMALPLVNGFPTMAFATLAVVAIGLVRTVRRRRARAAHAGRPAPRGPAPRRASTPPRPGPDRDRGGPAPRRAPAREDARRRDGRVPPRGAEDVTRVGRHDASRVGAGRPPRRTPDARSAEPGSRPRDTDPSDRRAPAARPRRARRESPEEWPPLPGDRAPRPRPRAEDDRSRRDGARREQPRRPRPTDPRPTDPRPNDPRPLDPRGFGEARDRDPRGRGEPDPRRASPRPRDPDERYRG